MDGIDERSTRLVSRRRTRASATIALALAVSAIGVTRPTPSHACRPYVLSAYALAGLAARYPSRPSFLVISASVRGSHPQQPMPDRLEGRNGSANLVSQPIAPGLWRLEVRDPLEAGLYRFPESLRQLGVAGSEPEDSPYSEHRRPEPVRVRIGEEQDPPPTGELAEIRVRDRFLGRGRRVQDIELVFSVPPERVAYIHVTHRYGMETSIPVLNDRRAQWFVGPCADPGALRGELLRGGRHAYELIDLYGRTVPGPSPVRVRTR